MNSQDYKYENSRTVDAGRRKLLKAAGAGAVVSAASSMFAAGSPGADKQTDRPLRWGIVGTGMIANLVM